LRYRLTLRDLAEMFLQRGIIFSHEAVRGWEAKLAPALADELRRRRHGKSNRHGRRWYVDETYLKVGGRWAYLYRAIDRDGNLMDTMLSEYRDMAAANTTLALWKHVEKVDGGSGDIGKESLAERTAGR
jgi:putative transposase